MNDELGDRVVYNPRGKNAEDDLAACILQAAPIFQMDGQVVWIIDGKRAPVFRDVVYELCRRFIVTARPVNHGTEAEPDWVVEYRPFVPDELMVRNLVRESLPRRAPVVWPEAAPPPPEPEVRIYDPKTQAEMAAGERLVARYASGGAERRQQELEAGQWAAAKHRSRGSTAA
jgi:hypothetical protein